MHHTIERELIIKNLTSVKVNYHWDIHKSLETMFSVEDVQNIFWIEPRSGEFPPMSSIKFKVYFNGLETVIAVGERSDPRGSGVTRRVTERFVFLERSDPKGNRAFCIFVSI